MRIVRVVINGRVQGVGYRAWVVREATSRRLDGWVRNRRDGTVEAVFAGDDDHVDTMLSACRDGPPAARVGEVAVTYADASPSAGFAVLPTS